MSHEANPFQQDRTVLKEHSTLCVPKKGDRGGSKFGEPRNGNRGGLISYTRLSDDRQTRREVVWYKKGGKGKKLCSI